MSSLLGIMLLCCVWQGSHGSGKSEFGLAVQIAQIAMNARTSILFTVFSAGLPLTRYAEFMAENEIAVNFS